MLKPMLGVVAWALAPLLCVCPVAVRAGPPPMIDRAPIGTLRDLGAAGADRTVDIAVTLGYRDAAGLAALVDAQADPNAPEFRHFLTPEEFAARFAPRQDDYDRVALSLRRAGFTVSGMFPNRTVILAEAPAPIAARAFATDIDVFDQPGFGQRYANTSPGRVPADIADVVSGVTGLSDLHAFTTHVLHGPPRPLGPDDAAAVASGVLGPDGGYGPVVYTHAYDLLGPRGFTGAGRAGAIVIDADFLDTDLAAYLAAFGITRTGTTTRVPVGTGAPSGLSFDSEETTLDLETMAAAAPAADLYVYEGPNFNNPAHLVAAYNQIVAENRVDDVNASLGYCETAFGGFPKMVEQVVLQGNALGITFHASTGDHGAVVYGCNTGVHVAAPASAPHVVAIGGTDLLIDTSTGKETAEHAWIDGALGATGGGVSTLFPLPAFQTNVPGVTSSGRNLPDVAFSADPYQGTSFYYSGRFRGPLGGTSLASPIFGGALLQLEQKLGTRLGFVTPSIYGAWLRLGYRQGAIGYFRDILRGVTSNAIAPGVTVGRGYDRTTGIGAMYFRNVGPRLRE